MILNSEALTLPNSKNFQPTQFSKNLKIVYSSQKSLWRFRSIFEVSEIALKCFEGVYWFLTSLGKGWTNVHPHFQNGSKKIISHRLFRLFLPYFGYYFFSKSRVFLFFCSENFNFLMIKLQILHTFT